MAIKDEVEEILRGEAKRHDDFKCSLKKRMQDASDDTNLIKDIEQQFVGRLERPKD